MLILTCHYYLRIHIAIHQLLLAAAAGALCAPAWPCPEACSSGMFAAAVTAFMTIRPSGMMYIHCKGKGSNKIRLSEGKHQICTHAMQVPNESFEKETQKIHMYLIYTDTTTKYSK
jgi:hypothetical protein